MIGNSLKVGKVKVEVTAKSPERILNLLWNKGIRTENVVRIDIVTLRFQVEYEYYTEVRESVKRCEGKVKLIGKSGGIFILSRIKRSLSLCIGIVLFIALIYILSTYVWAVEIETGDNLSPYEVRMELKSIGVTPGMKKSDLDVYELEKKVLNMNSDVLWIRARVEGSTLKLLIEEKVNPPSEPSGELEDCVAKRDGEIKRIFVSEGTSNVVVGQFVKEGDVLIKAEQGKEGEEYPTEAKGVVIANTFYEKEMEIQVGGLKLEKTDNRDRDIYLSLFGAKIYLKKAINNFEYYDKIEGNGGLFNTTMYFERVQKEVSANREQEIQRATEELTNSFLTNLHQDSEIVDKEVYVEEIGDGKLRVKVTFVVEEDIAKL